MKDYSNYFKKPSLNEAKRRSRNEIGRYDDVYHVPADMVKAGVGKKYYIQTYGCQANERDSETLSGILESMSYRATDEIKEADIIILNTCAILENAEEKVFGKWNGTRRENGFYDRDLGDIIMTNRSFAAEYFYFSFIYFLFLSYLSLTAK